MSHTVKVFSTPSCPWCLRAKAYLASKDVDYENIDVSQDQQAAQQMIARSGQQGVPQIWIDDEIIVGFDENKIAQLLSK